MEFLFWLSLLFILYTYFGYPILLAIISRIWGKPVKKGNHTPQVTMIITAYNEEKFIRNKLENTLSLYYPKNKFEIIVVSDGSTDHTDNIIQEFKDSGIRFIRMSERGGKAQALNAAVSEAKGEIIVFSDARQVYDKDAIRKLVANFNDKSVGVVSGELHLLNQNDGNVGEGVGMYWKYEKLLRKMESRLYSTSGATGAIYAIRRELYQPIPSDTILDDVVIPMNAVLKGFRIVFQDNANAYDSVSDTAEQELMRKIRTLCGNYQIIFRMHELLNPIKNKVFFQFTSHKVFRLFVPFALIFMFVSNIFLLQIGLYRISLAMQIFAYIATFIGYILSKAEPSFLKRLFTIPYVFAVLNYAAIAGLYRFITRKQEVTWQKSH